MKHLFKTMACIFLFATNSCCHAQEMMRTVNDAQKLQANEQLFIGKPLKMLLKEIKPQIKMVTVRESSSEALGVFIFKFVDTEEIKKYNKAAKYPLSIAVYVKEKLVWDKSDKPLERQNWTKEDAEKYRNFTILDIRVYGEN